MTNTIDLTNHRFAELPAPVRRKLLEWWEGPKRGLWVWGERCSGSSYIGKVALRRALHEYGSLDWDYYTALQLMDLTRESWTSSARDEDELSDTLVTPIERLEYFYTECAVMMDGRGVG